ncbi:MAG: hypothetical protein V1729_07245 [Candidatus Woesearchaeota archaeon]
MKSLDVITKLRELQKFKEWKEKNKESNLVHLFIMIEPGKDIKYDIGFFDLKKSLMTSFLVDDTVKDAEVTETKEIFTQDNQKITPLELEKVKIGFEEAFETSRTLQKEKYRQHEPLKKIVILQNLPDGQVWNITYITQTFQTLNMKIDAETGLVVEDSLHQIISFDK